MFTYLITYFLSVDTGFKAKDLVIAVGMHNDTDILNSKSNGTRWYRSAENRKQLYDVVGVRYHKSYIRSTKENDVAILVTADDMVFDDRVCPICLPSAGGDNLTNCFATGWGTTASGGIIFYNNAMLVSINEY